MYSMVVCGLVFGSLTVVLFHDIDVHVYLAVFRLYVRARGQSPNQDLRLPEAGLNESRAAGA